MRWVPILLPALMAALAVLGIYRDRAAKARASEEQKRELEDLGRRLKAYESEYLSATDDHARAKIGVEWGRFLKAYEGHKELPPAIETSLQRYTEIVGVRK